MKIKIAVLTSLALLVSAAPAAAGQGGQLDQSFGRHGKLILSEEQLGPDTGTGIPSKLLPLGQGRFLFAHGNRLFSFARNGALNAGFGAGGVVTLQPPAGETLRPNDVAIDAFGRILVAATAVTIGASPGTGALASYAPPPNRAAIVRLLPNGAPDTSFGSGGIVESTFGFPTATTAAGQGTYAGPSAEALSIASDSLGRPVVTGSWMTTVSGCYMAPFHAITQGYVARLGGAGNVEAVSTAGVVGSSHWGAALTPAGGERVLFQGYQGVECPRGDPADQPSTAAILNSAGTAEPSFAPATVTYVGVPRAALDERGRPLLSGRIETGGESLGTRVTRLRANGSLDPSFGHEGATMLPARTELPPSGSVRPVAADASNRPIVGGSAPTPSFSLTRLTARGAVDQRFGAKGVATIAFSAATVAEADAVMVNGRGQIVTAGALTLRKFPTAATIGIARYTPGS